MSTDPRWTSEAVEVVTAAIRAHTDRLVPAGGDHGALLSCSCGGLDIELTQPDLAPAMATWRRHRAEAVLAALAEAGLLVAATRADADRSPESYCHRCGGPNIVWSAPSPLWNEVMRGGDIDGKDRFDGIVCPVCFGQLAEGVAELWRLAPERMLVDLQTVTPPGRVWDEGTWLWREPPTASQLCECERWRNGATECPVHGTTKLPRVWAMPPEPGPDVIRVRDTYGQCFERAVDVDLEHGSVPVWLGDAFTDEADVPDLTLSWKQLMAEHAPLTEVDGDADA